MCIKIIGSTSGQNTYDSLLFSNSLVEFYEKAVHMSRMAKRRRKRSVPAACIRFAHSLDLCSHSQLSYKAPVIHSSGCTYLFPMQFLFMVY